MTGLCTTLAHGQVLVTSPSVGPLQLIESISDQTGNAYFGVEPSPAADGQLVYPDHYVSNALIRIDDWSFKTVFGISDGFPRVVGILATLDPAVTTGNNLRVVWYENPPAVTDAWRAYTWTTQHAWEAVAYLKARYNIPDNQDARWEVTPSESSDPEINPELQPPVEYTDGFASGDPLADAVNQLPNRDTIVGQLQEIGWEVADVPLDSRQGVEFFDNITLNGECLLDVLSFTISDNLRTGRTLSESLSALTSESVPHDSDLLITPTRVYDSSLNILEADAESLGTCLSSGGAGGSGTNSGPCRRIYCFGPWVPLIPSDATDCVTTPSIESGIRDCAGPFTVGVSEEGDVEITLPGIDGALAIFPGTTFRRTVTTSFTYGPFYVCVWKRTCNTMAERYGWKKSPETGCEWVPVSETQRALRPITVVFWDDAPSCDSCYIDPDWELQGQNRFWKPGREPTAEDRARTRPPLPRVDPIH